MRSAKLTCQGACCRLEALSTAADPHVGLSMLHDFDNIASDPTRMCCSQRLDLGHAASYRHTAASFAVLSKNSSQTEQYTERGASYEDYLITEGASNEGAGLLQLHCHKLHGSCRHTSTCVNIVSAKNHATSRSKVDAVEHHCCSLCTQSSPNMPASPLRNMKA